MSGVDKINKQKARALRSFIASFRNTSGGAPPCRSYRNLLVRCEFDDYVAKIDTVKSQEEIGTIKDSMKPFKTSINDLITQCQHADASLKKAIKAALKAKFRDPQQNKGVAPSQKLSFFEKAAEKGKQIASVEIVDVEL